MNKKKLNELNKIFEKDKQSLEEQGFLNVCTNKKYELDTNDLIPTSFTITYWAGINILPIHLIRNQKGTYNLVLAKKDIRKNVQISKVKDTLDKFKFEPQIGLTGKVTTFTIKRSRDRKLKKGDKNEK